MTIMHSRKRLSLVYAGKSMSFKLVLMLAVCSWAGAAVSFGADSLIVINELMASNRGCVNAHTAKAQRRCGLMSISQSNFWKYT